MSITAACLISALVIGAPSQAAVDAHREGMRLSKANKVAEAIEQLEKAVKLDPAFSEAWADLGNTHLAAGSMDEAIRAFHQAVKIREDFQIARYNLAYALRKTNAHAKAAEQYRVYLQRDPDDADAWYGLAESLRQANEPAAAADAYERYAKVEKRPAQQRWVKKAEEQAKTLRANAPAGREVAKAAPPKEEPKQEKAPVVAASKHVSFSAKAKKDEKAEKGQKTATAGKDGKDESASSPSSVAPTSTKPVAAGLAGAQIAAETRARVPKRPPAFDDGIAALKSGDYEAALARLEVAAKDVPEDAMVLAAIGSAHLGMREGREAERAYRKALAGARPEAVPGIWLGIGEAMRMLGDSAQALEAFDHVAKDEIASAAIKAAAAERAAALR